LTRATRANGSAGQVEGSGDPTIEGHAEQIRNGIGEAVGAESSVTQSTEDAPSLAGDSATSTANGSSGVYGRKSPDRSSAPSRSGPSVRRYDVGTWGAYHAARLATQGLVGAGKVSGVVVNRAANAGTAVAPAGGALRRSVSTVRSGASAASGAVSDFASHVADTTRRSMGPVRTNFSDAFADSRPSNESKSNQG
jgi:hypothetical protein